MPRPSKIDVVGQNFNVEWVEPGGPLIWGDQEVEEVDKYACGYTNAAAQVIRLKSEPDLGFDAVRDTLLHEVFHAIMSVTGLSEEPWLDEANAESVATRVAPVLLDVVRSNPMFIQYLQEVRP